MMSKSVYVAGGLDPVLDRDPGDSAVLCRLVRILGRHLLAVPKDVNRSQHRIASTNQRPIRMGATLSTPHGACGVA